MDYIYRYLQISTDIYSIYSIHLGVCVVVGDVLLAGAGGGGVPPPRPRPALALPRAGGGGGAVPRDQHVLGT